MTDEMRCAERDCENGGSDCNWIRTPPDCLFIPVEELHKVNKYRTVGGIDQPCIFSLYMHMYSV